LLLLLLMLLLLMLLLMILSGRRRWRRSSVRPILRRVAPRAFVEQRDAVTVTWR